LFDECKESANTCTFDLSGQVLAVGYDDTNIRIFNPKTMKMETVYQGHSGAVLDLQYDINNLTLVSASEDKSFKVWK
jgi:WD40 repeat protein